jgi:hypothetical protein
MEMAPPSTWVHGCHCLFECIFGVSTIGLNTLSLSFTDATNFGHDIHSLRRNLPVEACLPIVF